MNPNDIESKTNDATVRHLILPGWLDSDADHWQSHWEASHGCCRVIQDDWVWPRRGDWMARLDEVILQSKVPALLIAHSLGCQLVASWASHSTHVARVCAAFLVAPPDNERDDMPPNLFNWRPMQRQRLPFPAVVAYSRDDPYCAPERAEGLARDWGASFTDLGPLGHVNSATRLGNWPEGWAMVQELRR